MVVQEKILTNYLLFKEVYNPERKDKLSTFMCGGVKARVVLYLVFLFFCQLVLVAFITMTKIMDLQLTVMNKNLSQHHAGEGVAVGASGSEGKRG